MHKKLLLTLLSAVLLAPVLLVPAGAGAATITSSAATVGLGTTVVDLILDPEGISTGAWLVVLNGVGMTIDAISNVVPGGTDCFGLTSAVSFDGQCASMPLNGSAVVAQVTITATVVGGTLSLASGNITDFNTFGDTPFTPGVLLSVLPEPGALALLATGALGLAWSGRRRHV